MTENSPNLAHRTPIQHFVMKRLVNFNDEVKKHRKHHRFYVNLLFIYVALFYRYKAFPDIYQ